MLLQSAGCYFRVSGGKYPKSGMQHYLSLLHHFKFNWLFDTSLLCFRLKRETLNTRYTATITISSNIEMKLSFFWHHTVHPSSAQLKLVNPTQYRFEHLATQLKWRLQEGRGEAVYQIGVEDNGLLVGLTEEDMKTSLKTLRRMAEKYAA